MKELLRGIRIATPKRVKSSARQGSGFSHGVRPQWPRNICLLDWHHTRCTMFHRRRPSYTKTMKTCTKATLYLALSLALAANVRAAETPLGSLLACRSIQDDTARLKCFDRESASIAPLARLLTPTEPEAPSAAAASAPAMAAASPAALPPTAPAAATPAAGAAPSTAAVAATAPTPTATSPTGAAPANAAGSAPPLDPTATFGLPSQTIAERETAAGLRKKDLQSITAHIARISSPSSGRMVFDLDNHQVWQEVASEGDLMAKPGDEVKIWRGMLGSFWLQASTGRGCKVARLE